MPRAYDRTRHYMKMGDFVKIIGYEGEVAFFKIALVETMAQQSVLFGDAAQGIGAAAHIGANPIESDPDPVPYKFMEPVQELRLVQMRVSVYPTDGNSGAPVVNNVTPAIEIEANSPESERRFGTDRRTRTTMNGIAALTVPDTGGRNGGRIPANQVRRQDDQCEVFDMWIIHGYEPGFDITNSMNFNLGGIIPGPLDFNWYLNTQGRRYVLGKPTRDELDRLMKKEIPYKAVTLGGVTTITMEA